MNRVYKSDNLPQITLKYTPSDLEKRKISSSRDIFCYVQGMFNTDTIFYREESIIIFLDGANRAIGWMRHTTGGTNQTIIDIKMILVTALNCGAASIAISHNHPSGHTRPSKDDDKVTTKIKNGCEAIGLRFLDHVIVAGDFENYYSYCDEGKC